MGKSIVESVNEPSERGTQSKASQISKMTERFNGDEDERRHLQVFEQVCEALEECNDLNKSNYFV